MDSTVFLTNDEPGPPQNAEVLGDRRERHLEGRCQLSDRRFTARQPAQDCTPRRVGECAEDRVQGRRVILNHKVKC